jgi:hypothetical protein
LSVKTGEKKRQTSGSASVCRVITNPFPLSTPSRVDTHYSYHPLLKHPPKRKKETGKRTKNSRVKEGVNWDVGEGRIIRVDARMHNGAAGNV